MIQIKNAKELDGMRKANALSAAALKYGGEHIEAGMTTWELDKLIYDFIVKHGGIPNFKGLYGFPGTACISLNDTIIHGIPSHDIVIRKDDQPATVLDRLKAYHEQTEPLVDFYRQRGKLAVIPFSDSIEATTAEIMKALEA